MFLKTGCMPHYFWVSKSLWILFVTATLVYEKSFEIFQLNIFMLKVAILNCKLFSRELFIYMHMYMWFKTMAPKYFYPHVVLCAIYQLLYVRVLHYVMLCILYTL